MKGDRKGVLTQDVIAVIPSRPAILVSRLAGALALLLGAALLAPRPAAAVEETRSFGRFGTVWLYHQAPRPAQVVLFVSGDGGWNQGVVDMARELAGMDALVVDLPSPPTS